MNEQFLRSIKKEPQCISDMFSASLLWPFRVHALRHGVALTMLH